MLPRAFLLATGFLLSAGPSFADVQYVAANGSGNACSRTAPCGDIATAVATATRGDTVICLSTPSSSAVEITIDKSLTIDCSGVRGFVDHGTGSVLSNPIVISIQPSTDDPMRTVRLRGLTVDAGRLTRRIESGIEIRNAAVVYIEDCVISNAKQYGIHDHRTGGQTRLYVTDTVISGNQGVGIVAASQGVSATVIENVKLLNNGYGVAAAVGNNVVVSRSTVSGNMTAGVHADPGAQINLLNSVLSHNTANVNAYGTVRLQENTIQFSIVAIQGSGAVSLGSNRFAANAAPGAAAALATNAPADVMN